MKIYKYIGDGAGVPGLPHEIPEDEAEAYGNQFKAALEAGLYKLESPDGRVDMSEANVVSRPQSPRKSKAVEPAEGD